MTSFDYDEEQINKIINSYKNKRMREKERYERIKNTEEYKMDNRERARIHYEKYKEQKKENYKNNKEFYQARNSYYYYKKKNNLKKFVEKFPERVELLENQGFIIPI